MAEKEDKEEDMSDNEDFKEDEDKEGEDEDKKEKEMSEINLESEIVCEQEVVEKCHGAGCVFVCKAGEYIIHSVDGKLFASSIDNFDEKFEVSLMMKFDVTTINTGGVNEGEPQTVAPIKVSFEKSFGEITSTLDGANKKLKEYEDNISKLEKELRGYMSLLL